MKKVAFGPCFNNTVIILITVLDQLKPSWDSTCVQGVQVFEGKRRNCLVPTELYLLYLLYLSIFHDALVSTRQSNNLEIY